MRAAVHAGATSRVQAKHPTDAPPPDSESILWMVRFYASKIPGLCKAFRFPLAVEATACAFFHRFYLRHSPIEHSPKDVMLTCLYLATKTENSTLPLKEFAGRIAKGSHPSKRPSTASPGDQQAPPPQALQAEAANNVARSILQLEFTVSQALNFEFAVHGAHRALAGMLIDLVLVLPDDPKAALAPADPDRAAAAATAVALGSSSLAHDPAVAAQRLTSTLPPQTIERAYQLLVDARLSDAELLFAPVQIAYAVFRAAVTRAHGQQNATEPDPSLCLGKMWFASLEARAQRAAEEHRSAQNAWRSADAEAHKEATTIDDDAPVTTNGLAKLPFPPSSSPLGLTFDQLELVAHAVSKQIETLAQGRQTQMKPDELRKCDQKLQAFLGATKSTRLASNQLTPATAGIKRDNQTAGLDTDAPTSKHVRTDAPQVSQ